MDSPREIWTKLVVDSGRGFWGMLDDDEFVAGQDDAVFGFALLDWRKRAMLGAHEKNSRSLSMGFFGRAQQRCWRVCLALLGLFCLGFGASCDCGQDILSAREVEVRLAKPVAGPVAGNVEVLLKTEPAEGMRFAQVYLTSQSRSNAPPKLIAELHDAPFQFRWNSWQEADGFYRLEAVVYDEDNGEYRSSPTLIQIVNEPPKMWFVNCKDGQWIRGLFSLVVSLDQRETSLRNPPTLFLNGEKAEPTLDAKPPFRFFVRTTFFQEGEKVSLAVEGEDLQEKRRRIVCFPRVDNEPPTLQFRRPNQQDTRVAKEFSVEFDVQDRFGVREVRLWVDGSSCQSSATPAQNDEDEKRCEISSRPWVGTKTPLFPIQVKLSEAYKTEQSIVLTARAVDRAGNLSTPPTQLRVRVDPVAPEIFIRAPGKGELLEGKVTFRARVVDNHLLKRVEFLVKSQKKLYSLMNKTLGQSEWTGEFVVPEVRKYFGYGRQEFWVRATDASGNVVTRVRPFTIGCTDTTDCPLGKVCFRFQCLVPAQRNEKCNATTPCAVGLACMEGDTPVCSETKQTYCRKRCNPGNKYVSAESCPDGFFCSKTLRVCVPGDGCIPLSDDCGKGKQCIPADDDTGYCVPVGTVKNNAPCEQNCSQAGNCRRGSWCVFLLNVGTTACLPICNPERPSSCPGGRCIPLQWSFGGNRLRFGVCE